MKLAFNFLYKHISKLTPQSLLLISFALAIFLGSILLMQPFSLQKDEITFVDALFTSASATCVTGLTVVDTGSFFTSTGQIIILLLNSNRRNWSYVFFCPFSVFC